ncbi:hypothetical protein JOE11_000469 [Robbsia andropogonis]
MGKCLYDATRLVAYLRFGLSRRMFLGITRFLPVMFIDVQGHWLSAHAMLRLGGSKAATSWVFTISHRCVVGRMGWCYRGRYGPDANVLASLVRIVTVHALDACGCPVPFCHRVR